MSWDTFARKLQARPLSQAAHEASAIRFAAWLLSSDSYKNMSTPNVISETSSLRCYLYSHQVYLQLENILRGSDALFL